MNKPFYGTKTDFYAHETKLWGEDYVDDLLDKGYDAILTTAGWKWVLPTSVKALIKTNVV